MLLYQLPQAIQTQTIMLYERFHHHPSQSYKTLQVPVTILLIQLHPVSLLKEDIHYIYGNQIHGTFNRFVVFVSLIEREE